MYKELALLFKTKRKRMGITQFQLAFHCGISRSTIVNIENGKQRMFLDQVFKIRKELKISMKEIVEIMNESE